MIGRAVDRYEFIVERCYDATVLHVGCADAPYHRQALAQQRWLHDDLAAVAKRCVGLDLDESAIEWIQEQRPHYELVGGDVTKAPALFDGAPFDVVVLSEVLEHLEEPGLALRAIAPVLKRNGRLIVTVPNGLAHRHGIMSLLGREIIHPDHVAWYSRKAIAQLLARTGWDIKEVRGYRLTRRNGSPVMLAWDMLASLCSEFACEGIAATAVRMSESTDAESRSRDNT